MTYALVFLVLLFLTVVNAIVALPGSSVVTPLLTVFMSPKDAIAFAAVYFMISSIILVVLYRKYIRKEYFTSLIWSSLVGAVIGAVFYVYISELVALLIALAFVVYFTLQKIAQVRTKKQPKSRISKPVAGVVSGFLQGGGFSGGDVRNGYLYSKGLDIQEVRATTAAVGASVFLVATLIRGFSDQLDYSTLWLLIPLTPVLIIGTLAGRYVTLKLSKWWQNAIIIGVLLFSIGILVYQAIRLLI